jgi:hypothetical protein
MVGTLFGASSIHYFILFWKNTKISIFGGISKFLKLIVFVQILANFDALSMAESIFELQLNSLKSNNS